MRAIALRSHCERALGHKWGRGTGEYFRAMYANSDTPRGAQALRDTIRNLRPTDALALACVAFALTSLMLGSALATSYTWGKWVLLIAIASFFAGFATIVASVLATDNTSQA